MPTLRSRRAGTAGLAATLTVLLAVDPFGLAAIAQSAQAAVAPEDRASNFADALSDLSLPTIAEATEVEAEWPALEDEQVLALPGAILPSPDEATVVIPDSSAAEVELGGMAVQVAASADGSSPEAVSLQVRDAAATAASGVAGVLLDVVDASDDASGPATVDLSVSYAGFAGAYGGDWASRLRVVWVPDCAADTPAAAECQPRPIESVNDPAAQTVTAVVPVEPAPPAAAARTFSSAAGGGSLSVQPGVSGSAGDWSQTTLPQSSNWGTSGNTGAFTWSYPLALPSPSTGLVPELAVSYSSAVSDGRVPSANTQAGWIGEGFELTSNYIERQYVPCADDPGPKSQRNSDGQLTADLCWGPANATFVFKGASSELLKDGDVWRSKVDDGTIAQLVPATGGNDEHWVVTTTDGTRYFFGRDSSAGPKSAWKVPVYGNDAGEPGYQAGNFAGSRRSQIWRWNLDRVQDPSGNTITYTYATQSNAYLPAVDYPSGRPVSYTSGGRLTAIEYGTRAGSSDEAPFRVVFDAENRCLTNRADGRSLCKGGATETAKDKWLDSPRDLECKVTDTTCSSFAPTFYDTTRLSRIRSEALVPDSSTYKPLSTWDFTQRFVGEGDNGLVQHAADVTLRLDSIKRTAHKEAATASSGAGDIVLPTIQFGYTSLPNRVDSVTDGHSALWRDRVTVVRTESGAQINVTYRTDCANGAAPANEEQNTKLCFRVKWTPDGAVEPEDHWFHKYVVASTVEAGGAGSGSVAKTTRYEYPDVPGDPDDGAFWAKPTGPLVKAADATRSEFRGFRDVILRTGEGADVITASRTTYFRGTGKTLSAKPGSETLSVKDWEQFAGQTFSSQTMNGDRKLSETINLPGTPAPALDAGARKPTRIPSITTYGFTFDNAGKVAHRTRTKTTNNDAGLPVTIDDRDLSNSNDYRCTTITYAPAGDFDAPNMRSFATETTVYKVSCEGALNSANRIRRDTAEYDAAGRVTTTSALHPTNAGTNQVISTLKYDALGRVTRSTDAEGNATTTTYTPDNGSQLVKVVTTTPDPDGPDKPQTGFASTQIFHPLTGMPETTVDPNGLETAGAYDALGRVKSIRYPQHAGSQHPPSLEYEYDVKPNGLNGVLTRTLGADGQRQHTSVVLYDGLGRPFQRQVEASDANVANRGRMISKIIYDVHGRVKLQTSPLWVTGAPALKVAAFDTLPDSQTTYVYDGAGRVVRERFFSGATSNDDHELWHTDTHYDGATTLSIPPRGGMPTATVVDARGRTVELIEYARDPDTQSGVTSVAAVENLPATSTKYSYDAADQLTSMVNPAPASGTAPAKSTWSYEYDLAGRQVEATDPDGGTTVTDYDRLGRVAKVTNGNGDVLAYSYDNLGRVTGLYDDDVSTGAKRATWEYDTATFENGQPVRGQLRKATRFVDGKEYVSTYAGYDKAYRPTKVTTTLPEDAALHGLSGKSFSTAYGYAADGQVERITHPGVVGANNQLVLGKETVTTYFDAASMPSWMSGGFGWGTYVAESAWTTEGKPLVQDLGNTYGAVVSYDWNLSTGRLNNVSLNRERVDGDELHTTYQYDAAGNVTGLIDVPPSAAVAGQKDAQCFQYDGLRRLQTAWTDVDANCGRGQVAAANVGGVAPYWNEYTYDSRGNRTSLVERAGSKTTTTTYKHGENGDGPHQLSSVAVESTGGPKVTTRFTWDEAGNQTTRAVGGNQQTQTWDAEGELVSVTGGEEDVANVFDADGTRLVRIDDSGVTVFLPGGQEVHATSAGVTAKRWYSFGGMTVAVRTGKGLSGVTSVVADAHGTPMAHVHNTRWNEGVQRVRTDPFGAGRAGSDGTVEGRGFLGAPADATGFTMLGARFYDPDTGTFLSVDPELAPGVPAQFNAYVYSANNPMTWSDPSGRNWFGDIWNAGAKFIDKYQAEIGGVVVGVLVTGGCLAVTAGMGSVGCFVAGGAAGGAVTNVWKQAQSGKSFNVGSFVTDTVTGGATGLLGPVAGVAGRFIAPVASRAVGALTAAVRPAASALTNQVKSFAGSAIRPFTQVTQRVTSSFPSASRKATSCVFNSFVAGTLVLLANGSKAPIENLAVGDEVLATDPETGETSAQPVVATITGTGEKDLVTLTIVGSDGVSGSVVATSGHPFWVPDARKWVDAGDLQPGQWLQTSSGTWVQITAVQHDHREQTVYNLTVNSAHTYYVYAGAADVLTHNCGGPNASQGFGSFSSAKRALPSPGQGHVYDHVVEQSQMSPARSGFEAHVIHNPANLNAVPAAVNQLKANYYASIRPFTGGARVRDWLNGQSFEAQFEFGMDVTRVIQRGGTLP